MLYRPCPDLPPPTEAEVDTPEMVETAAGLERDERDVRMLQQLAELGMELAVAIAQNAKACLEAASAEGVAASPEPMAAFNKMAQTVRRTLALKAKLGETVKTARTGLAGQRAERRAKLDAAHLQTIEEAIETTFGDTLEEDFPDLEGKESEALLSDLQELLFDGDEFKDYLERPVGETVAKLRAAMGLDPALCVLDGETWKARRPPYAFEATLAAINGRPIPPSATASLAAAATGPPG